MSSADAPRIPDARGTATAERRLGPDLARGFMLLLIAMAYAGVYAGAAFGLRPEDAPPPDAAARFLTTLFLDDRVFSMFAILYGYGLAWMFSRQMEAGTDQVLARGLLRRRSLLLLFGAVHAFLVFPGEILASYGLAGLVLGWLLTRSDRALVRAVAVLVPVYAVTVGVSMVANTLAAGGEGVYLPGYTTAADWLARLALVPFSPLYTAFAYPLFLLVVLGMWAGRRKYLHDPARHRPLLVRAAVLGAGASLLGALPAGLIVLGVLRVDAVSTGLLLALQVLTGVLGGAGYAALFGLIGARLQERPGRSPRSDGAP